MKMISSSLSCKLIMLTSKSDFEYLRNNSSRKNLYYLTCFFKPNRLEEKDLAYCAHSRFAFAISKKFGNSVQRNYLKRILREHIRHRLNDFNYFDYDLLILPRHHIQFKDIDFNKIGNDIHHLLKHFSNLKK